MPSRWNPIHEADRHAQWLMFELGRELRVARVTAGRTQSQVARAIGRSTSGISRVERGKARWLSLAVLVRHGAAVGLRISVRPYPNGRRPLDAAQLALLRDFNERIHPSWTRRIEVAVPIDGDLRAADEVISIGSCSCAVEAITRLADVQAQVRAARLKARDLRADRLILLVRGSHPNRRLLAAAGPPVRETFGADTRRALRELGRGRDPGADCLVIL